MNIAIISKYPFPYGLAASNRIYAYSKGLVENGTCVKVYLPYPGDISAEISNNNKEGVFNGINYCYTSYRRKSKYRIIRGIVILFKIRKIIGIVSSIYKILNDQKSKKYDFIIISSDSMPFLYIYSTLAKFIESKSIFIFDEYPTPIRHKLKTKVPKIKEFLLSNVLKKITAYISISENLSTYYNHLRERKTFILSGITDFDHFHLKKTNYTLQIEEDYLCYMGNLELAKDNIDLIIKAFAKISKKFPKLNLFLYGNPNVKTIEILNDLIKELKMENKIKIKGKVNFRDVPSILNQAKILVSSQPDTIRASGGFPTKLGEYLATGKPVLVTDVGENSKYLVDNVHVFFAKPNDSVEYAKKLDYILENYDRSLDIAKNGQSFIKENFSTSVSTLKLIDFLQNCI